MLKTAASISVSQFLMKQKTALVLKQLHEEKKKLLTVRHI